MNRKSDLGMGKKWAVVGCDYCLCAKEVAGKSCIGVLPCNGEFCKSLLNPEDDVCMKEYDVSNW